MKAPDRAAAAQSAANRRRGLEYGEALDQFDRTVTDIVAEVIDSGFHTVTVSWSPAASGHTPF
jgi:glycine cleavage system protein P-like pyridoxal-binding family